MILGESHHNVLSIKKTDRLADFFEILLKVKAQRKICELILLTKIENF